MAVAGDLRVGNVLNLEGKICKVISQEMKGSGKVGKTMHMKLKSLEDGHMMEKSLRAEEKIETLESHRVKMQYSYKDANQYVFMNMETYEQFSLPEKAVGKQSVFLKENSEIGVDFVEGKAVGVDFPKIVELQVTSTPAPMGGGATSKEAELENGLKILVPQFVKTGEFVRIDTDDFAYLDRVTTKSMKTEMAKPEE
ncbi:MAG TPA: elongation factor P [Verrucomicrobiae bacterium]|jgi:elongation factor P|nr:elongation factor P [Verrucomicrobiae bacterium]